MAKILDQILVEGRHESEGHFTIDPYRALPKLGRYQLPHPAYFVLKWVQWGVASGASRIAITLSGRTARIAHDGARPGREQLDELPFYALRGKREPLRHLAIAINAIDALEPVDRGHSWVRFRKGYQLAAEGRLLKKYTAFCPVPITLNGARLDGHPFGAPTRPWLFTDVLERLPFQEEVREITRSVARKVARMQFDELRSQLPWWYLIWHIEDYVLGTCHRNHHVMEARLYDTLEHDRLGLPRKSRASLQLSLPFSEGGGEEVRALVAMEMALGEPRVAFVRDGVLIPHPAPRAPLPGLVAVISANGLNTDASDFSIVEDEAFHEMWEQLRGRLLDLRQELQKPHYALPLGWYIQGKLV